MEGGQLPPPVAPAGAAPSRRRRWWIAPMVVAVAAVSGGVGYLVGSQQGDDEPTSYTVKGDTREDRDDEDDVTTTTDEPMSAIEQAASDCGLGDHVTDAGETIVLDTEGEDDFSGDSFSDVTCILTALDTPARVTSAMDSTRALDGTLEDSWESFHARWNYHPDNGMNLTIWIVS